MKTKIKGWLSTLDLHMEDAILNKKIEEKEQTIFGVLDEKEENILAKEIAFELAWEHFLKQKPFSHPIFAQTKQIRLKQNQLFNTFSENEQNEQELFISKDIWQKWIDFFIHLFDIDFRPENVFRTVFTIRLYNGTILQCYSPYFYHQVDTTSEEENQDFDDTHYTFSITPQNAPLPYTYLHRYAFTEASVQLLKEAIQKRYNLLFISTNKKCLHDIMQLSMHYLSMSDRNLIIEKTQNLQINLPHMVRFTEKKPIPQKDYINAAFRMRPDRMIIEELEDQSMFYFCSACNTGHDGSMANILVSSFEECIPKLTEGIKSIYQTPTEAAHQFIADALDMFVLIDEKTKELSFYGVDYQKHLEKALLYPLLSEDQNDIHFEYYSDQLKSKNDYYNY